MRQRLLSTIGFPASVGGPSAGIYGLEYEPDGATLTTTVAPSPKGGSTSSTTTTTTSPTTTTTTTSSSTSTNVATSPKAVEELLNGCSGSPLVLNDVYIQGTHVEIRGSAIKSYVGKKVKILFNEGKSVATATVEANGQYTTTAPLPPVKIRECGKTTVAKTFTPSANGRFHITLTVPANARAAIFRLTSKVAANKHSVAHGFTTFSLPLPVAIG